MAFSSLSFLFLFLPPVLLLYVLFRTDRARNVLLLLASLFFYAWGAPRALPLLAGTALLVWGCGIGMEKGWRLCFPLALVFVLGSLLLFKYLGFFAGIIGLGGSVPALLLPAGISFTSFQLLAYLFDLRRGSIRVERRFDRFLLYVCFFPQLLQGPILRYGETLPMLSSRALRWEEVHGGARRFLRGLGKKVLLADRLAVVSAALYGAPELAGTPGLWLAALCYTLQIYFDFSGYSDMAIGLGHMFGFTLPENFRHPYCALSVTDFWRRWHVTLSLWFRDYVYIPLGGNRVSRGRFVLNLLTVWALTGLWHGASWNFVLWGLYYGVLLILEKLLLGKRIERVPKLLRWLLTFTLVNLGWVLFHITDLSALGSVLRLMFGREAFQWRAILALDTSVISKLAAIPLGLPLSFPIRERLCRSEGSFLREGLISAAYVALFFVCVMFLLSSTFTPFIYFNF
ncbi:MAG: MBOAT family protein [Oscillospiraceae bacterium]|nr:MBOAT family protein [Oscillospiraceae bacterium]